MFTYFYNEGVCLGYTTFHYSVIYWTEKWNIIVQHLLYVIHTEEPIKNMFKIIPTAEGVTNIHTYELSPL